MSIHIRIEKDRQKNKKQQAELYWKKEPKWYLWFQDFDDERFREIPGYHGAYFVSDYGKVISFTRKEPREINQVPDKGEMTVTLSLDGKGVKLKVPGLVYRVFGGYIPEGAALRHKNGDTGDNSIKNLEPVRTAQAAPHPPAEKEPEGPMPVPMGHSGREVLQFDLHGRFIQKYPSMRIAAQILGGSAAGIGMCAKGTSKTSGGYQWFFVKDPRFKNGIRDVPPTGGREKKIYQFSLEGKYLRTFASVSDAAGETKIPRSTIDKNLKGVISEAGFFQFRCASNKEFRFGVKDIPPVEPESKLHPQARGVLQFDLHGRFIAEYSSVSEAGRAVGIDGSNIGTVLKKKRKSTGGFQWRYRDEAGFRGGIVPIEPLKKINGHQVPTILQFDLKGRYIWKFKDAIAAAKAVGANRDAVLNVARGITKQCGGFLWRFEADPFFKDGIRDIPPPLKKGRPVSRGVLKFSRLGRLVETFPTVSEAGRDMGVSYNTMVRYIEKGHPDETVEFYWEFE